MFQYGEMVTRLHGPNGRRDYVRVSNSLAIVT